MGAEINRIPVPQGAMVSISDHEGRYIAGGPLLEDFNLSFSSEFGPLMDSGDSTAFTVLGGAMKSLSGSQYGWSGNFKQMGFQIWKGTEPITLQFNLEFHYTYSAYEEVVLPIQRLCRLPLPGEGRGGNLIPPGPSVLEAISGTTAPNTPPSGDAPAPAEIDIEATRQSVADSYVNIKVGNMLFMGCIVKSCEPVLSKYVDEDNYPIYGRVAVTAITMYTATKEVLDRW